MIRKGIYMLWICLSAFKVQAVTITGFVFTKASYERYEKAEATFSLSTTYSNPYDTAIVQVDAEITPPSGPVFYMPCFYYVPCTYYASTPTWWEANQNVAGAKWMLRYAPTQTGTYQVRIRVLDGTTSFSGNLSFTVTAGTRKGFVRIDGTRNQFMRFDNGTPYYPIGYNLCWNDGRLVNFFQNYMTNLDPNNVNWTRYWLTGFARQALEWQNGHWSGWYGGLGQYSQRSAGILDSVLNLCEQKGVYMQLVLQHHGQVSTSVNPNWAENPHNSANGGPCGAAGQFFTNATSRGFTKKMYRYVIARWGYSSNVMSWELFNEVEYSDGTDANIDSWHDEMSRYLKYWDPYDHMVNTSSGQDNSTLPLLDNNPALDQLQWHTYSGNIEKTLYNESRPYLATYNKPVMCGEFGTGIAYPNTPPLHPDDWGDHVRKSMWIGMFSETPNMFWYWDEYIRLKNQYAIFKPLGNFLNGIDIVGETGGVGRTYGFAVNPSVSGTVSLTPGNGAWGFTNIPNPFSTTVTADGDAAGLNNLCVYLHGSWQGARSREASFTVTFNAAGTANVILSGSSGSGTNALQIYLDGALQNTWAIPNNTAGTYTITGISAGTHTIRYLSSGQDWLQVNSFNFTNAKTNTCKAYGYHGTTKGYGYILNQLYGQWADPAGIANVTGAQLKVGKLNPGSYVVSFYDPIADVPITGGTYTTGVGDTLTFPIPTFKKDIAYKINPSPVPVSWLSYEVLGMDNSAQLIWETAYETNTSHFVLEWSIDAITFSEIGQVPASGNSAGVSSYSFMHNGLSRGLHYYRIRQMDLDGNYVYSPIMVCTVGNDELTLLPNPAGDQLGLEGNSEEISRLEIYTVLGQKMDVEHTDPKLDHCRVYLRGLSSGIYLLQVHYRSGRTGVYRFIKE